MCSVGDARIITAGGSADGPSDVCLTLQRSLYPALWMGGERVLGFCGLCGSHLYWTSHADAGTGLIEFTVDTLGGGGGIPNEVCAWSLYMLRGMGDNRHFPFDDALGPFVRTSPRTTTHERKLHTALGRLFTL